MAYSKRTFSTISNPNRGKLVVTNGKNAQWMAQATEAEIPKASQLNKYFFVHVQFFALQNYWCVVAIDLPI